MASSSKRTVLITGCSDGGMGAELAKEFHKAGLHVYATARDVSKMKGISSLGIETLALDVQSGDSIKECVMKVPRLDMLVNNAGAVYTMPLADLPIEEGKKLFDLNVWAPIATTQAFLPLLLKSPNPVVVNHTSTGAGITLPFQGVYNASKAAMVMLSDTLRLELEGFGVKVVDLRTGGVKTNIVQTRRAQHPELPEGSIYTPAKEPVNSALRADWFDSQPALDAGVWAKGVVGDVLKSNPPPVVWRGANVFIARLATLVPFGFFDSVVKKMVGLDKVNAILQKQ